MTSGFIVVGTAGNFAGLVSPQHLLTLTDNGRPVWTLTPWLGSNGPGTQHEVVWLPKDSSRVLSDGLLLAGVHAVGDPAVREAFADAVGQGWDEARLDFSKCEAILDAVDDVLDTSPLNVSVVVVALEGSSLEAQLSRVRTLTCEVEVTVSAFRQTFDFERQLRSRQIRPWTADG